MLKPILFQIVIIALCIVGVTVAVLLDLASGIRKAKQNGCFIYSYKIRKTVDKFLKYYSFLALASFFDVILMLTLQNINQQGGYHIIVFPFFALIVTFICFLIEVKSIKENADVKQQKDIDDGMHMLFKIVKAMSGKEMNELIDTIKKIRNGKEKD